MSVTGQRANVTHAEYSFSQGAATRGQICATAINHHGFDTLGDVSANESRGDTNSSRDQHRSQQGGPIHGVLRPLGLSDAEEQVCVHVFQHSRATVSEIARATGLEAPTIRKALANLERHALIARTGDATPRYVPAAPATGLEALGLARRKELEEAIARANATLASLYRAGTHPSDLIEVINDPEAAKLQAVYAAGQAISEVMCFFRPPYTAAPAEPEESFTGWNEGVRALFIFDQETLEFPGFLHRFETTKKPREEYRLVPKLPMKLTIVDRKIAFMPLTLSDTSGAALMVRPSSLLEALIALFERFWQEGVPFGGAEDAPRDEDEKILALLAAGMTDEAIARQLSISTRSLRRRISRLQEDLGARNRFQVGAAAVRKGRID